MEVATVETLRPDAQSPRHARRVVRELLEGSAPPEVIDAVLLAVSELVTNAVEHAGTALQLRAGVAGGRVRVEVVDGSGDLPRRRQPSADSLGGRGLLLVEEVADSWGVDTSADGKAVWFERALSDDDSLATWRPTAT